MLMEYSSEGYSFIVDSVVFRDGTALVSAQTETLDVWSVHLFKSDHPDYKLIEKLKEGDKIHFVELPGEWSMDAGGERYRVKRDWSRRTK